MKNIRQAKLAALKAVLNGDKSAVERYQEQYSQQIFVVQFVDYSGTADKPTEPIKPTDLVDTLRANEQGQTRISYAEFQRNPALYGNCCFSG